MQENDGCTYLIVMQGAEQAAPRFLPKLPPNARFVHHANECFDIGTVGWVLNTHLSEAQLQQYDYFIWMNPSVRGPFMPAYLRGSMHWTEPLLSKLRGDVKLVGPTISCEHATIGPAVNKAHVQTYVVATDREGMAVLRRSGTVFNCWGSLDEVIQHSEVGTSQVIFAAGWSIDSLMLRYQVSGGAGAAWALASPCCASCSAATSLLRCPQRTWLPSGASQLLPAGCGLAGSRTAGHMQRRQEPCLGPRQRWLCS